MAAARAFAVIALATAAGAACAAPVTYFGLLSGAAENPANGSAGSGVAVVTVDETAHTLYVSATFSGLTTPNTAAHIHCCSTEPVNAGVATPVPTFPDFPASTTSGTYTHTFDTADSSSYNPTFVSSNGSLAAAEAALFAGIAGEHAYFNIHTTTFPGGEIRSFLHPDEIFADGLEPP